MHDKLQILLEKIGLPNEYYSYFKSGNLDKISGNKNKDSYTFFITIEKSLPLDIYHIFVDLLTKSFNEYKVSVVFNAPFIEINILKEYYQYFIGNYAKENPLLGMFKDNDLLLDDSKVIVEVANKAESMKLNSIKDKLISDLKEVGLDITFQINVNKEKSIEIKEKIDAEMNVEVNKKELKKKGNTIIMGEEIKGKAKPINELVIEDNNVIVEAYPFAIDYFDNPRSAIRIITLKLHDNTNSILCKIFYRDKNDYEANKNKFKVGKWYKIRGYTKNDSFSKELVLNVRDINEINKEIVVIKDEAKEKRVELHAHTFMSQMDGLIEPSKLVKKAYEWGHKSIAITDHNSVQAFPDVYHTVTDINKKLPEGSPRFKALYGAEFTMVDDNVGITFRPTDDSLLDSTYVVFDFETTGFNAAGGDQIIEVGAVMLKNGEIIDRFEELIDPMRKLPEKITEITGITDEMLKGKDSEEMVIKRFKEWFKDYPLVAHNAKFDMSFLDMAYKKYNLGEVKNTVIDTLELSRALDNSYNRHSLSAIVKRYDVAFDEESHHRGVYDAEATALVLNKMIKKLVERNIETIKDLSKLVSQEDTYKFGRTYHVNVIARNKKGLKNLFKLISYASTKYLYKTPRILRSEILAHKEGLLIGSGCYESEVFTQAKSKSEEELTNIINFYDYVEVQPLDCYSHLLETDDFSSKVELMEHVKKIIRVTEASGKLMVATGDVHHLSKDDKIYRKIIVNQKVPGGGRHPLSRSNITDIPSNHFRTTEEMINDFSFIDESIAKKIVIENPNKISDMVEEIEVIIETGGVPFSPKIENSPEIVKDLVYTKAREIYGDNLPQIIEERLEKELSGIINGGFDVIYLIAQKLVKKSNDDGYLVGSRGSVGSSLVATFLGISEVNPLPPHYACSSCKESLFELDGKSLGASYSSGFDLPDYNCPKCNTKMEKDGQDIPFATFLGFDANKVPDIDLNFSGDYQAIAHEYTKEIFGEDNVYRAGTIGTVADKTAYGFVKGYCEDNGITDMRGAEVERLALGCTGVKRTTGQHPGGIVVIPNYMDVFDFTPYQYPADDEKSAWRTTHFDYHAIDQDVLKLDILGHDDPTVLRMLQDLTGVNVLKIPLDDKKVLSLFNSPKELGVTEEQINCTTGTLGIPEFGTNLVISMLDEIKPQTFADLVKISGLSHGTGVYSGNAQDLIVNKTCEFKEVIGCRDDIMVYLIYNGLKPKDAFKIMEFVRKGKPSVDKEEWEKHATTMREAGIVDWYIDSCKKIQYMFPKSHAAAYVMSGFRIAYFKLYHPLEYYASYFSIRSNGFDFPSMIKGYNGIKAKINELTLKARDITNKEKDILDSLNIALEASARGIKIGNIDLYKSHSRNFIVSDDNTLIPPFRVLEGLGDTIADKIVEERDKAPFLSIEDFKKRGKVSATVIDTMRLMGILDDLDESSQLALF